jgi:uncharacterized FAD-dependent dehydrogenase
MKKDLQLQLSPEEAYDDVLFQQVALKKAGISPNQTPAIARQTRRSIDARGRQVRVNVTAEIFVKETPPPLLQTPKAYQNVSNKEQLIIVGAGPAGLFAALRAIELGVKPIVIERGKDVRARRRDLAAINKEHIVNPESNYCFGEGGAGNLF